MSQNIDFKLNQINTDVWLLLRGHDHTDMDTTR